MGFGSFISQPFPAASAVLACGARFAALRPPASAADAGQGCCARSLLRHSAVSLPCRHFIHELLYSLSLCTNAATDIGILQVCLPMRHALRAQLPHLSARRLPFGQAQGSRHFKPFPPPAVWRASSVVLISHAPSPFP